LTNKKTTTQTIRLGGQRVRLTTRNGKVTAKPVGEVEWKLQAAAVRRLKAMPEFGKQFLLAGDQAAAKRGPKAQMQAIATGLTPGDPDLRLYLPGGRVAFIEYKTSSGRLSPAQRTRHADMQRLGHEVEVIVAATEDECADKTEALVRRWLAGNDNNVEATSSKTAILQ
jgi:hypothetical protein